MTPMTQKQEGEERGRIGIWPETQIFILKYSFGEAVVQATEGLQNRDARRPRRDGRRLPEVAPERLVDPGEVVVVYCHHGMRSARAAGLLRARERPLAFSMAGGIDRWSCEVDPRLPRY